MHPHHHPPLHQRGVAFTSTNPPAPRYSNPSSPIYGSPSFHSPITAPAALSAGSPAQRFSTAPSSPILASPLIAPSAANSPHSAASVATPAGAHHQRKASLNSATAPPGVSASGNTSTPMIQGERAVEEGREIVKNEAAARVRVSASSRPQIASILGPVMGTSQLPLPLILERGYIRWIPGLAISPTTMLRLITPNNHYIDLSLRLGPSTSTLIAATAGTYYRTRLSGLCGHLISTSSPRLSHHYHTLTPLPSGSVLQSGESDATILASTPDANEAHKGAGGPYEELWRPHPIEPRIAVVILLKAAPGGVENRDGSGAKGMVVRVGSWCQGIAVMGGRVVAERWVRRKDVRWERVCRVYGVVGGANQAPGGGKARLERVEEETEDGLERVEDRLEVEQVVLPCSVACLDRDMSGDGSRWQGGRFWKQAREGGFSVEKTVEVGDWVTVRHVVGGGRVDEGERESGEEGDGGESMEGKGMRKRRGRMRWEVVERVVW